MTPNDPVLDLIGVGFGPANLALAVAVDEHNTAVAATRRIRAVFFERQPRFGWHRDMLIEGTTVQVSFLKDLVTMRTPASRYSFLSYLQAKGRLVDFINHKTMFPSRVEFHDYFEWVAAQFVELVEYSSPVVGLRPVVEDGMVVAVAALVRDQVTGDVRERRAHNVVIAAGLRPCLPPDVTGSDRVWHSDELLGRLAERPGWRPRRIVVVGAGQSAAEVVDYLHRRYAEAEVCAVFSRYGYSPADDSPFANRVFDPDAVDHFYRADSAVKRQIMGYHSNTNYSVVDLPLIEELYRREYQERITGQRRLQMINLSRVTGAWPAPDGVQTAVLSLVTGRTDTLDADVVICATGYRPVDPGELLGELSGYCLRDEQGRLRITRGYQVATTPEVDCGIYVQGATEHTHGIGSTLLSNLAVRSGEITRTIAAWCPSRPGRNGAPLGERLSRPRS